MLTDRTALGFKDVLIVPKSSDIKSRKEVSLERTFTFKNGLQKTFVPIVAANMANIGTFKVAKVLAKYKMLTCMIKGIDNLSYHEFFCQRPQAYNYTIPTFGLYDNLKLVHFFNEFPGVDFVCLDVANGYMSSFTEWVSLIKKSYPEKIVMAGNVATAEGALALYRAGADIVKVGIGSGSVCTTRFKTGVGVPQITAVHEVAHYGDVCSDGGCTGPGDIAKAFVAGADLVMIGGMLAGTLETGVIHQGSAYVNDKGYKTSEGKWVHLDLKTPDTLDNRIQDILGGLRSTGSYIGERQIENFYKAELIQVREQTNDIFGKPE